MAFTYDLTADLGKVRLNLGDTVENAGPRPDRRNFSDAEVTHFLTVEGTTTGATAMGFETLASEWAGWNLSEREGEAQFDAKGLADYYWQLSNEWRSKPDGDPNGVSSGTLQAGVIGLDFMEKIPESETT